MRSAILLIPAFFVFSAGGAQDEPRFQVTVPGLLYEVRVRDEKGRVLRGLRQEDFILREEGRARPVLLFEERGDLRLNLAILVDTGGVMSQEKILNARQAILRLIHLLDREDRILLATYSSDIHVLSDLTSDRYELVAGIENIASGARPGTFRKMGNLFMSSSLTGWAVDESLRRLKGSGREGKIVLVFSAGFGGVGEATLDHLQKAGARFFGVSYGNRAGDIFSLGGDQAARKRIVRDTGGFAYEGDEVLERIEQVRDQMKHAYLIAYSPAEGDDDLTKRRVTIGLPGDPKAQVSLVRRTAASSSFY